MTIIRYISLHPEYEKVRSYDRRIGNDASWSWREYEGYRTAHDSVRAVNMFDDEYVAAVF